MLLEFKRCRHCGSEYEYQASGCGCRNPNNDKDYCPECMKIILEALNNQPVKFTKRYMEIDNKSLMGELLKVKESVISKKKSGIMWPGVILITTPELSVLDYDNIELYEYQSKWEEYQKKALMKGILRPLSSLSVLLKFIMILIQKIQTRY